MTDDTGPEESPTLAVSWYLILIAAGAVAGAVFFTGERGAGAIVGAVIALVMALSFR